MTEDFPLVVLTFFLVTTQQVETSMLVKVELHDFDSKVIIV